MQKLFHEVQVLFSKKKLVDKKLEKFQAYFPIWYILLLLGDFLEAKNVRDRYFPLHYRNIRNDKKFSAVLSYHSLLITKL